MARLPFEASPTGRWVRFDGAGEGVYVVRDAFGDGCVVLSTESEGAATVNHFRDVREVVAFATALCRGRGADEPLTFHPVELAAG